MYSVKFLSTQSVGRGTSRRLVEGQSPTREAIGDGLWIAQHVGSGDAYHSYTSRLKPCILFDILRRPLATIMRFAIDLDDQPRCVAIEIRNVRSGRVLPAKLQATGPLPQHTPQQHFRQ